MEITDTQIFAFFQQYFLPFVRFSGLFLTVPVIGTRMVPTRAKIILAALISIVVSPLLPPLNLAPSLSLQTFLYIFHELTVGIALGFCFQVVFHVFVLSGQFMAMKMGLGFASMNDPTNGVQTTVLSQFFLLLVTLLFVNSGGHLILIEMLVKSFSVLQPTRYSMSSDLVWDMVSLGAWLFSSALLIALPVLTSLLVINIAFGVMSRAAPQLNIFAIGFPFTLICGMALVWVGLQTFMLNYEMVFQDAFEFARRILRG